VNGPDRHYYEGSEPILVPRSSDMNFNVLCSQIYRIIGWTSNIGFKISGRCPIPDSSSLKFMLVRISNDSELDNFDNYMDSVKNVWPAKELYVEPIENRVRDIGTCRSTEVGRDTNVPSRDHINEFDRARVCNNLTPEVDSDEEDEPDVEASGSSTGFTYTNQSDMKSVGRFRNPPADEFEDVTLSDSAITDFLL
jgi:hypothetical protein